MKWHAYQTEVELTPDALILTGTSPMGRANLRTLAEREVAAAERKERFQETGQFSAGLARLEDGALVIPRADITSVELEEARNLRNGTVTVTRRSGRPVPIHFRRKQAAAMRELVAQLS